MVDNVTRCPGTWTSDGGIDQLQLKKLIPFCELKKLKFYITIQDSDYYFLVSDLFNLHFLEDDCIS